MLERDKKTQKRYAFLMGANGPFNQHLKYAEKDVERLAKALTGDLCAFTSVVSNIAIELREHYYTCKIFAKYVNLLTCSWFIFQEMPE